MNPKAKYLLEVIANLRSKFNIDQKFVLIAGINKDLASLKAEHHKQKHYRAKVLLRLRTIKIAIQRDVAEEVINGDQQKYPLPEVREAVVGLLLEKSLEYQKLTQEHTGRYGRMVEIARDIESQENRRNQALEQIRCYQAEMGLAVSLSGALSPRVAKGSMFEELPPEEDLKAPTEVPGGSPILDEVRTQLHILESLVSALRVSSPDLEPPEAVPELRVLLDDIHAELGTLEVAVLAAEQISKAFGGGRLTDLAEALRESLSRTRVLFEKIPEAAKKDACFDDPPPE